MKKILSMLTITIMAVFLCTVPVYAAETTETTESTEDGYYNGPVDPITYEPIGQTTDTEAEVVEINSDCTYVRSEGMFRYQFGQGYVSLSVVDGMITTGHVRLQFDAVSSATLYKDGDAVPDVPEEVYEPGSYTIASGNDGDFNKVISFQIVNKTTGTISQYVMPDGFHVKGVQKDGEEVTSGYTTVDLEQEGYYQIVYSCNAIKTDFALDVTIDHTPPAVVFEGVDDTNKAKGPVTVTGMDPKDTITIYRDNKETRLNYDNELTESGVYRVTVSDEAGNTIEKNFKIMIYLNLKAWMVIVIIVAIIAGVAVALYITRKRLRVR